MSILSLIPSAYAQSGVDIIGKIDSPNKELTDPGNTGTLISSGIQLLIVVAGLYAFLQLLVGGFNYVSSSGDAKKAADARQRIINSIIGLAIITASFIIIRIATSIFFGGTFDILNPQLKTL